MANILKHDWKPKEPKKANKAEMVLAWWIDQGKPMYHHGLFAACQRDIWKKSGIKTSLTYIAKVLDVHCKHGYWAETEGTP